MILTPNDFRQKINLGSVDLPIRTPTIYDDEFNAFELASKWTVVTNSAGSVDFGKLWPSCIRASFTGNQQYAIKQSYAPAGDFSITAKFHAAVRENYQGTNIYAYDDDESDGIQCAMQYNSSPVLVVSKKDASTWTYNVQTEPVEYVLAHYLHVQRVGSTWALGYSTDGRSFTRTDGISKTFTVHHFNLSVNQGGASHPVFMGIDWVRINWITL